MKFAITVGGLLLSLALPASADVIKLRADTWCPFNCDPGASEKGYVIEVAEYAFAKKGHTIDYQNLPWTRALADVAAGKIDGAVGATALDAKNSGLMTGKEGVGATRNCMYAKNDSTAKFAVAADLKNFKRVGIVQEYSYGDDLDAVMAANKGLIDAIGGEEPQKMNINKLEAGRVDGVLEDGSVMAYALKKLGAKGVKKIGCERKTELIYIAFSSKSPKGAELAQLLDDGIKELRKNGKLKSILAKYGIND
jgi:polar amino acid transport system substrate-binding protein